MKVDHLKVRPRKVKNAAPCALQLATMLNCWASKNDFRSIGPCADAAQSLRLCMGGMAGGRVKPHKPTINYHLARLGKQI
ncbi:uncharacterized protein EI90DRAFT_2915710 [Cantharellus anzutake]|uniref:uncharacterized protein n=1 Tax=Cantharellus anzutake TaxID=1750568 RepID=UPI001905A0F7|nr:uncharacterized protein EI90DRAFT_2915710 [Cantharellus anzutake]KAF8333979.1 hypothetical protein EI90DRAFT_2915710 [Cantharellus anzutake]